MAKKSLFLTRTSLVREKEIEYVKPLNCPEAVIELVNSQFNLENADQEHMVGVYLNTKLYPYAVQVLSIGTADTAIVSPREIFKPALLCSASRIILAHNHPSGDPTPSKEDHALTRRMREAGELLGIEVVDHIIIGHGKHYSFRASEW